MTYPRLRSDLQNGIMNHNGQDVFFIENNFGARYIIDEKEKDVLFKADGSHPINLEQDEIDFLIEKEFLTTDRIEPYQSLNLLYLIPIGRRAKKFRKFCIFYNRILPYIAPASLLFSIIYANTTIFWFEGGLKIHIILPGLLLSVIAHEFGHFISATANHLFCTHAGLLMWKYIPVGAFVSFDMPEEKKAKIETYSAGILQNLLLAGLFLIGACSFHSISATLFFLADINFTFAVINAIPIGIRDGSQILAAIRDEDFVQDDFWSSILEKEKRNMLRKSGTKAIVLYALKAIFTLAITVFTPNFLLLITTF